MIGIISDSESECGSSTKSDLSSLSKVKTIFQPTLNSSFRNITEFADNGTKGVRLSNAILYMICKDAQPLQIVENEGFQNLLKVACPLYKVPSRYTFKRMLENKFQVTQNYFKDKIKTLNSIVLTTDIWTDTMQTRSFLGVTIHFLEQDNIESGTLGVYELSESHTGEYIANMLLLTCEEWAIDIKKVMAVITDGGANMIKAVYIAFGKKRHMLCFAHLLNLVAQNSIDKTDQLPNLIASIKKIVTWFKHCVVASDELRKESDLKLIQDVSTRWNSTFYMIERFLKLRAAINIILICHASAPPMVTAKDIVDLTEVCDILRPIEFGTREISSEKFVTSSKVIPLIRMLNVKISSMQPKQCIGENLIQNIKSEITKRLLPSELVTILAVSTLLDPRFKNIHFQDVVACSKAIKAIKDMLNSVEVMDTNEAENPDEFEVQENTEAEFNLWSDHYKLVQEINTLPQGEADNTMPSELSYYLKNPLVDLKQNPLQVWNNVIGTTYPKLKIIASKYLSCVATSTASERLFTKAGSTLSQRNRLSGKLLTKILFLQSIDKKLWDL